MSRRSSRHPSTEGIARIAVALRELADHVVFVGGAIAPLLQTDPPFDGPRPTREVDAVIASTRYAGVGALHARLRALGFRRSPAEAGHLHRWLSPEGDMFDLVTAGDHPGGSGQIWDRLALESSVLADVGGGQIIRHASAPMFLALKLAAYADRGAADPFASHDLEDVLALLAARPGVVAETKAAALEAKEFIARSLWSLQARPDFEDLLAGHLNNAQDPARTIGRVRGWVEELARLVG